MKVERRKKAGGEEYDGECVAICEHQEQEEVYIYFLGRRHKMPLRRGTAGLGAVERGQHSQQTSL